MKRAMRAGWIVGRWSSHCLTRDRSQNQTLIGIVQTRGRTRTKKNSKQVCKLTRDDNKQEGKPIRSRSKIVNGRRCESAGELGIVRWGCDAIG